jgi:hypothetical protein
MGKSPCWLGYQETYPSCRTCCFQFRWNPAARRLALLFSLADQQSAIGR